MFIIDIANEIYSELGEPAELSLPVISYWLTINLGGLNNLIGTTFTVDLITFELDSTFGEIEKAIFKKMYTIYYYGLKMRENLGAASLNEVLELSSDGATIRSINKNDIAKMYNQLKMAEEEELDQMATNYGLAGVNPQTHLPAAIY